MAWRFVIHNQASEPYDEAAIRNLIELKLINAGTLAWQEGQANWKPSGEIPELAGLFPSAAPAAAPAAAAATVRRAAGLAATLVCWALAGRATATLRLELAGDFWATALRTTGAFCCLDAVAVFLAGAVLDA